MNLRLCRLGFHSGCDSSRHIDHSSSNGGVCSLPSPFFPLLLITGLLLDEDQVRSIVEEIKQVVTASLSRIRYRAERAKAEYFDAEEGELLKEENEQEDEVLDQVGEILRTLVKTFKASLLPFFEELSFIA